MTETIALGKGGFRYAIRLLDYRANRFGFIHKPNGDKLRCASCGRWMSLRTLAYLHAEKCYCERKRCIIKTPYAQELGAPNELPPFDPLFNLHMRWFELFRVTDFSFWVWGKLGEIQWWIESVKHWKLLPVWNGGGWEHGWSRAPDREDVKAGVAINRVFESAINGSTLDCGCITGDDSIVLWKCKVHKELIEGPSDE